MGPITLRDALRAVEARSITTCLVAFEGEPAAPPYLLDALPSLAALCRQAPADTYGSLVMGCLRAGGRVPAADHIRAWLGDVAPRLLHDRAFPVLDLYADCYLALDAWVARWNRERSAQE